MQEIKTVIATTNVDQLGVKFSKNVLRTFADQINNAIPRVQVFDGGDQNKNIGEAKHASFGKAGLSVTMNINEDKIDTNWEYFFIPEGLSDKSKTVTEDKAKVVKHGKIMAISMVMFPTDLTLKPVTFTKKHKEEKDYFIRKYDEVTADIVHKSVEDQKPLYVYYPDSLSKELVESDAAKNGLLKEDGEHIDPIRVYSYDGSYNQFRNIINEEWTKINTGKLDSPKSKATEKA